MIQHWGRCLLAAGILGYSLGALADNALQVLHVGLLIMHFARAKEIDNERATAILIVQKNRSVRAMPAYLSVISFAH